MARGQRRGRGGPSNRGRGGPSDRGNGGPSGSGRGGPSDRYFAALLDESSEDEENVENEGVQDLGEVYGEEDGWQNDAEDDDSDDEVSFNRNIRIRGVRDIPVGNNDEEDSSSDNDAGNAGNAPPRSRRVHHRNKAINSLSEALNPSNYDMLRDPSETREVSAELSKRPVERIVFTNQRGTQRGRPPRLVNYS